MMKTMLLCAQKIPKFLLQKLCRGGGGGGGGGRGSAFCCVQPAIVNNRFRLIEV